MAGTRLVQVRLGEGTVWVEAVVPPGTQPTAALDKAADRVLDAFEAVPGAIADLATKVSSAVEDLASRSVRPDEVGVEFGLKLTTTGSLIVASGTGQASLLVKVTYKKPDAAIDTAPDKTTAP